MINKNDEYMCDIISNGSGGEGVCRIDGFTVFVPDSVKGDRVRVKILKVNSRYAFGKVMEIITPSPSRVNPVCSNYKSCGGCDIACMDYEYQLELKRENVGDALYKIGGIDLMPEQTVGMDNPYYYRNKMQFPVSRDKDGKIIYGFYAKRSHNIVSAENCVLGNEKCTKIMNIIVDFMEKRGIEPYVEEKHTGLVRHVFIRDSFFTGEIMVVIVINGKSLPFAEQLTEMLVNAESNISGIILNINKKKTNLIMGDRDVLIYGKNYITDKIGDLEFSVSPHSFYQINPVQTKKLYSLALDCAGDLSGKTVFDLYCGTGTIGLFMAKNAQKVYGIEIVDDAVKNARENAIRNGIQNAQFFSGAVEDIIEGLYDSRVKADVVVLDPPRKGSDNKTLDIILKMDPSKIIYVSCNPATLARDLKVLTGGGYKVEIVTPVDMFPQTSHVETVVLMSRVEK